MRLPFRKVFKPRGQRRFLMPFTFFLSLFGIVALAAISL